MNITLFPGKALITATPEEGRKLAIKMARLGIKTTQGRIRSPARRKAANSMWHFAG
ncbi:hexameric tyrosine-coordinated heme protein [Paraburkholderia sp. CNPSo 3274]|uniref:hexameric tyrosine-coordinated heme protein n=1 Tax=Paraburkholderia sp. CNPSo 3274 TaxID=2940932 RepID=UPI0020B82E35|nr:hexameric tyrosine-coordinated heme protein [Paraburkholderia sp. CNPSo 3274]MCP3708681.1 hexameric tyrosine-coordinated heme protein [Paraburkholderia sp. CNPSo 3274]